MGFLQFGNEIGKVTGKEKRKESIAHPSSRCDLPTCDLLPILYLHSPGVVAGDHEPPVRTEPHHPHRAVGRANLAEGAAWNLS